MSTLATVPPPQQPQLSIPLNYLTHIDITALSQSELHVLSLCSSSSSAVNSCHTHDLVVPKIDRSVFNESAGSRRQTYSRPGRGCQSDAPTVAAAAATTGRRRRVAGVLGPQKLNPVPADDPERNENRVIIAHLKHLISQDPKFDQIDFQPSNTASLSLLLSENQDTRSRILKRKRGRKAKAKVLTSSMEAVVVPGHKEEGRHVGMMEMVNNKGATVDVSGLANAEDPFGEELRRRTVGLQTEEELLGFMRELGGQWGSRRRKRKIVDASEFGDSLPLGWKLLLAIKRKEGLAWIYCRRILSPTGQQFLSCKEVSSFLHSFIGLSNGQQPDNHGGQNVQIESTEANLNKHADRDGDGSLDVNLGSALLLSSISNEREKEVTKLGMENFADATVQDVFECHKCSMTFIEKDPYLQHLLTFHQRTTRRYRLGSTVGDGVIIKDGKYECQFCHKVFLERRRYNGHVGIHVRNYVRKVEEFPGPTTTQKGTVSTTGEGLESRISKMDALIEIAQNSILETSTSGPNDESKGVFASKSHEEMNIESPLSDPELEASMIDRFGSDQHDSEHTITDGSMDEGDDSMEVVDAKLESCLNTSVLSATQENGNPSENSLEGEGLAFTSDDLGKGSGTYQDGAPRCQIAAFSNEDVICNIFGIANLNSRSALDYPNAIDLSNNKNSKAEVDFGTRNHHGPVNDTLTESVRRAYEINELQIGISDSSMPLVQPLVCLPTSDAISGKGEDHLSTAIQRHDHETGFEGLKLDEIEPLKYGFTGGQDSLPLEEVPINLANNCVMEKGFGSSVQFESEEVMLNMAARHQVTTVCVWCGAEFNHEAVDSEIQPDSVGFMCPACKAKISGQLILG